MALGHRFTDSFRVTNLGPAPAKAVLHLRLSSGISFVSGRGCRKTALGAQCSIGALSASASTALKVILSGRSSGTGKATGIVTSSTSTDPVKSNSRVVLQTSVN